MTWRFGFTIKRWFVYSDLGPFALDFGYRPGRGWFWSWNDSAAYKEVKNG